MLEFIDTHSHIDMPEFDAHFDEMLNKCEEVGVKKIIIPGVNVEDTPKIINLIDKYDQLYALVGLHPEEVSRWNDNSLDYFKTIATHKKVVGIGEIGLDYYWDKSNCDLQQKILALQVELAKEIKKPIVIHDRDAHFDTFNILKDLNAGEVGVVFHCFSGSAEFLKQCLDEGYYISLGGITTFKNAKKPQKIAQYVPLDRLFLETDAPYLTPVPFRGEQNYPYHIPVIAGFIADLRGISIEEIATVTTNNAKKFFNLD